MTLFEKIEDAIKIAMKNGDKLKRDCLRGIVSDVKNQTINAGKEITDDACIKALQKSSKMHNDSIAQFVAAGRVELADKEKDELLIINSFLPKMLNEAETTAIVKETISNLSNSLNRQLTKKDMGIVMKELKNHIHASEIDMKIASKAVSQNLC